jgi:hypothetical protein
VRRAQENCSASPRAPARPFCEVYGKTSDSKAGRYMTLREKHTLNQPAFVVFSLSLVLFVLSIVPQEVTASGLTPSTGYFHYGRDIVQTAAEGAEGDQDRRLSRRYVYASPHRIAQGIDHVCRHHVARSGKLREMVIFNRGHGRKPIPGTSYQ